ncbi:hypothetical protein LWI29_037299 [Acer saccharum]|uniref:Uncharacterized protein n=1 Tax=Acer saccharum TaxID=4024 RepID=A0AA39W7S5_ACESA|nr:hypothetical protein LWI29_037299 [Acer saccharum]
MEPPSNASGLRRRCSGAPSEMEPSSIRSNSDEVAHHHRQMKRPPFDAGKPPRLTTEGYHNYHHQIPHRFGCFVQCRWRRRRRPRQRRGNGDEDNEDQENDDKDNDDLMLLLPLSISGLLLFGFAISHGAEFRRLGLCVTVSLRHGNGNGNGNGNVVSVWVCA